jgi:hypothetical protein
MGTVGMIVGQIGAGHAIEQILADYPSLEREDVLQALRYVAWLAEDHEIVPPRRMKLLIDMNPHILETSLSRQWPAQWYSRHRDKIMRSADPVARDVRLMGFTNRWVSRNGHGTTHPMFSRTLAPCRLQGSNPLR